MTYQDQLRAARFIAAVFSSQLNKTPLPEREDDLAWSSILAMARAHSLLGLVFSLYEERLSRELPAQIYAFCSKEVGILDAKHIAQKNEFAAITERFIEEKIYFMPLKGFLIKSLYPSPELRTMNDLDVLVFPESVKKAKDILLSMGYFAADGGYVHDNFLKPPFIEIELHKMLSEDWEDYSLERSLPSEKSEYWRLMSDEDFFIFILKHAAKHDNSGGCGIRAVLDFSLIKAKLLPIIGEEKLLRRISEAGLLDFYKSLSYLESIWLFGGKEDAELLDFEIYTVSGGAYGTRANGVSRKIKNGKLSFFITRIFPPYSFMKKAFPILKKCPVLLPFLYPWRIIRGIFRGSHKKDIIAIRESQINEDERVKFKSER